MIFKATNYAFKFGLWLYVHTSTVLVTIHTLTAKWDTQNNTWGFEMTLWGK